MFTGYLISVGLGGFGRGSACVNYVNVVGLPKVGETLLQNINMIHESRFCIIILLFVNVFICLS
jgi:hypothetical protein